MIQELFDVQIRAIYILILQNSVITSFQVFMVL